MMGWGFQAPKEKIRFNVVLNCEIKTFFNCIFILHIVHFTLYLNYNCTDTDKILKGFHFPYKNVFWSTSTKFFLFSFVYTYLYSVPYIYHIRIICIAYKLDNCVNWSKKRLVRLTSEFELVFPLTNTLKGFLKSSSILYNCQVKNLWIPRMTTFYSFF